MNIDQPLKHEEKMGNALAAGHNHDTSVSFSFNKNGIHFIDNQL